MEDETLELIDDDDVEGLDFDDIDSDDYDDSISTNQPNKSSGREKVDNVLDNTATEMVKSTGVPEPIAKMAVKTNGGPLSPTNTPVTKMVSNSARNKLGNVVNKLGSNNDSDMLKKRLQQGQMHNQNQARLNSNNRNQEEGQQSSSSGKSQSQGQNSNNGMGEKVASKGLSTAAQAAGVPKPIADIAGDKLAGPLMQIAKKKKQQMMIAILVPILVIMIPIICLADVETSSKAESEERNDYLYGSGSEDSLYTYLDEMGYCNGVESCSTTEAATFYKKLKSVLDSNQYLTKRHADTFITEMISYGRDEDEVFKHSDEIQYIADIIGKSEAFDISNANNYKEEFVKEGGYFDTYRKEDLLVKDDSQSYKEKIYSKIVKNSKHIVEILVSLEKKKSTSLTCSYDVNGKSVSNIKVRLLQCGDDERGEPIAGETLIDFEKYILGVVYAENGGGPTEGLKAQAIAARTYALLRGDEMNGAANLGLTQENGQWILSIRNCTEDQVYCDPDKGCWSNDASAGGTVHSGYDSSKAYAKGPLAEDSPIRTAVAETSGKVLVDTNGKMIYTPYTNTQQNEWNSGANAGKDHFELLKGTYSSATKIITACSLGSVAGDYTSWKQNQGTWISIPLGNSKDTIRTAGCLVTSVAIQIAKSGTLINVDNFDPGVFVQHLNKNGGFTSDGNFYWNSPANSGITPNFIFYGTIDISGTKSEKTATIKSYQNQGYYIVIRAQTHQHWVSLDKVVGDEVYIFDPATNATKLWEKYPDYDVTRIAIFKNDG